VWVLLFPYHGVLVAFILGLEQRAIQLVFSPCELVFVYPGGNVFVLWEQFDSTLPHVCSSLCL
jgi:hypothetical protein